MAASDHLHPQQLRMFMSAAELKATPSIDMLTRTDKDKPKSTAAMWRRKDKESAADGLNEHVAAHGVHAPVTLGYGDFHGNDLNKGPYLMDGHHRVGSAFKADPQSLVPVEHVDYGERRTQAQVDEQFDPRHSTAPGWEPKSRFPSYP